MITLTEIREARVSAEAGLKAQLVLVQREMPTKHGVELMSVVEGYVRELAILHRQEVEIIGQGVLTEDWPQKDAEAAKKEKGDSR